MVPMDAKPTREGPNSATRAPTSSAFLFFIFYFLFFMGRRGALIGRFGPKGTKSSSYATQVPGGQGAERVVGEAHSCVAP